MAEEILKVAPCAGILTFAVGSVAPVGGVRVELRLNGHSRSRAEFHPADSVGAV